MDRRVPVGLVEAQVAQGHQVLRVHLDQLVALVLLGLQVHQGQVVPLDRQDLMGLPAPQDHLDHLDLLAQVGQLVLLVPQGHLAQLVEQVQQGRRDQVVLQVLLGLEQLGRLARQDPPVIRVPLGLADLAGQQGVAVLLDQVGRQVHQALEGQQEQQDPPVLLVQQAQEPLVLLGLPDLQAQVARMGHQAPQVLMAQVVLVVLV